MDTAEISAMYDFSGKSFVVTGGAGVLCSEMVCALVGCGADVAILDRDPALAERLIQRIQRMDKPGIGRAVVVYGDVLKRDTLDRAAETVRSEFGGIYGLINGAGGNQSGATTRADLSYFDLPEEALRAVIDLNLLGALLSTQAFARVMVERGEGVILNITSINTYRPLTRVPAYAVAKAGISNFTQWLAVHLAQTYSPRIRVNAIAPGFFLGEQNRYLLIDQNSGQLTARGQAIISHTPMARFGAPEDLLGTVLWLLSPASAFVTGAIVPVDGGFSAYSGV
jgi:NAD(P)-dependent dehydrogenase (short-subunit alcohol dehydrogenase family)